MRLWPLSLDRLDNDMDDEEDEQDEEEDDEDGDDVGSERRTGMSGLYIYFYSCYFVSPTRLISLTRIVVIIRTYHEFRP